MCMNTDKLRLLTGVQTGHYALNKRIHRMVLTTSAVYRNCVSVEETPIRLVVDCADTMTRTFGIDRLQEASIRKSTAANFLVRIQPGLET